MVALGIERLKQARNARLESTGEALVCLLFGHESLGGPDRL